MAFSTDLYYQRPDLVQEVDYTLDPSYITHQAYEDKLAILVCQIKIWEAKDHKWFDIPKAGDKGCLTLRECESVEVNDSAKELMGKAVVKFPRGTVISLASKKTENVKVEGADNQEQNTTTLQKATNDGEVMTPSTSTFDGTVAPVTPVAPDYDDKGLIDFNRHRPADEIALLTPDDVAVGNRIEIRLGYAYSEQEAKEMNAADHRNGTKMPVVFTGFITSISVDTPLELECTNMAHLLACISTPNINAKDTITVGDFLDENGTFRLLEDTGIPLAECSKGSTISVAGGTITDNLTVFDVLSAWNKSGVLCMMETLDDGRVQLRVGLTYYAGGGGTDMPNTDKRYITYNGGNRRVKLIQFDWDVANDKLALKSTDKKYLAVEAHGKTKENLFFKLTVRKNPDKDDEGWIVSDSLEGDDFQVVNNRKVVPRKKHYKKDGTLRKSDIGKPDKKLGKMTDKVDMKKYSVVPYFSLKSNITEQELIEEAKQYWAKYNPNGISGSIEIFGDLLIRPTDIVGFIDMRQPKKNGYYYVESVNTSFGPNGYRRELKIPFKIASFKSVTVI